MSVTRSAGGKVMRLAHTARDENPNTSTSNFDYMPLECGYICTLWSVAEVNFCYAAERREKQTYPDLESL